MSSVAARPFSRKVIQWLPWIAALVFVAGGVAFLIAFFGNTAEERSIAPTGNGAVQDVSGVPKTVPVDPDARMVAGKFITTAVTRKDLKTAWSLTEPNGYLRPPGLTFKQWMTGNIPVQVFPAEAIDAASYRVESSFKNELTLNVYIFAKPKSGIKSQAFFIVLHPSGTGKNKRWLVNNFIPSSGARFVPSAGEAGGVG
jgi:hypothetical protein